MDVTRQALRNAAQTGLMLLGMAALLATVGWSLAGAVGLVLAGAGVILLTTMGSVPTEWILRARGALPVSRRQAPWLTATVQALAEHADLRPVPVVYVQPSPLPNAFSVGERGDSAIVVSEGLMRLLDAREMTGVLAHELSHVRNGDTRVMRLATTVNAVTRLMSRLGLLLILLNLPLVLVGVAHVPWLAVLLMLVAPMVGTAMQLALSRSREIDADAQAARLTGDPLGLASALARLERGHQSLWRILVGLPAPRVPDTLRSHPATDERIRRLRAMATRGGGRPRLLRPSAA